ncbi:MAG TPA: Hsp20/alpha crystallin family protein [Noviherbaspirillum sp.]|nr:Hsp20/alpha crystallin family protein [Noviherbaspirillum sp.]
MAGNLMRFDPMRELTRFDPFRGMDDMLKEFSLAPSLRGLEPEPRIRLDITESDDAYEVKADVPGVKKEDIKISIEGGTVSIRASAREESERKEGNMMCSERYYGEQYRSFTLPAEVDDSKAEARYQDGVLHLKLPKKEGRTAKQITVQ